MITTASKKTVHFHQDVSEAMQFDDNEEDAGLFDLDFTNDQVALWCFNRAQSSYNLNLMQQVLNHSNCIPHMEKAKALAFNMLNGKIELSKVLLNSHVSVREADIWFSSIHRSCKCDCGTGHKSSLLIRLVRQNNHCMVSLALDGGLDPNGAICDGNMKAAPNSESSKTSFEILSPLAAASTNNDLVMIKLLLKHGAKVPLYNYSAFALAARHGSLDSLKLLIQYIDQCSEHDVAVVILKNALLSEQDAIGEWVTHRAAHQTIELYRNSSKSDYKPSRLRIGGRRNSYSKDFVSSIVGECLSSLIDESNSIGINSTYVDAIESLLSRHDGKVEPAKLIDLYLKGAQDEDMTENQGLQLLNLGFVKEILLAKRGKNSSEYDVLLNTQPSEHSTQKYRFPRFNRAGRKRCQSHTCKTVSYRKTVLMTAVKNGHAKVVEALISACDISLIKDLLVTSTTADQAHVAKVLLHRFWSKTKRDDKALEELLLWSVMSGSLETTKLLMDEGIRLSHARIIEAYSCIMTAYKGGAIKSVSILGKLAAEQGFKPEQLDMLLISVLNRKPADTNGIIAVIAHFMSNYDTCSTPFIREEHLHIVLQQSCGSSRDDSNWHVIFERMLKMYQNSAPIESYMNTVALLVTEAEELYDVHSGILHELLGVCEDFLKTKNE